MDELFYKWFLDNQERLEKEGIHTEIISKSQPSPNPSVHVDHCNDNRLGRITVWQSGLIDMEILDQQSAETVFYKHLEVSDDHPNIEYVLEDYFKKFFS